MNENKKRGRPRKEQTKVISKRVSAKHAEKLGELFNEIIKKTVL